MKEADINKTAIISRLKAYRERNGARAYRIVAHYVGSKRISDLERLSDEDLQGDELTAEIDRAKAITGVASQIIANGTLALKARVIADNSLSADFTVPAMLED